ncbi:MAP6 domain-containing protein 1 [Trichomycterus rosablanca]|uniref:MAP6 domain-containing protein 1 n=1 Tax=Trichomycterus rosablanca TaxID=2290929 RepID=UPI002F35C18D
MAWPCISRVCCLARFWNQFDKSDLSVPLTIQNYSDTGDRTIGSVSGHVGAERATGTNRGTAERHNTGGRRASRRCTEQTYKARQDAPFPGVTQYKQDYKAWPIPKKENHPWISNASGKSSRVNNSSVVETANTTSLYRQEYKPWAGVQPSKPAQKRPTFLSTTTSDPPPETSYQAAFNTDTNRHTDITVPENSTHTQPSNLERADRVEVSSRAEEQLVRKKSSPNAAAVFQSKSRIFNI